MKAPLCRVVVVGSSMLPSYADGDWLVMRTVRDGRRVKPGQVVLVEQPDRPGFLLVKRVVRRERDGWWVEGDNAAASDDSRTFGVVADGLVLGRVLCRYGRSPRAGTRP